MSSAKDSVVGTTLSQGRYRIRAKLGDGGMGSVYLAHDGNLDTSVVIKMPRRAMLEDAEFAARFAREVRALVQLKHPHIVKVSDVGDCAGIPFAVMEYLPGGNLEDRYGLGMEGGARPSDPRELSRWLPTIATALDFAHSQGYIHRDVKAANILFDSDGNAFLGDFGVAKLLAASGEGGTKRAATGTGIVLGTPGYMAPEVILGATPDGRADQYALSVVTYEVLTGRRPYEDATPTALLVRQTTTDPRPVNVVRAGLSAGLASVVSRGMSREPSNRYSDCASFARALITEAFQSPAAVGASATVTSIAQSWIRLFCPLCNSPLRIPPAAAGKNVRCPTCSARLSVQDDLSRLVETAAQGGGTVSFTGLNVPTPQTVIEPTVKPARDRTVRVAAPSGPALTDGYALSEPPPRSPTLLAKPAIEFDDAPQTKAIRSSSNGVSIAPMALIGAAAGFVVLLCGIGIAVWWKSRPAGDTRPVVAETGENRPQLNAMGGMRNLPGSRTVVASVQPPKPASSLPASQPSAADQASESGIRSFSPVVTPPANPPSVLGPGSSPGGRPTGPPTQKGPNLNPAKPPPEILRVDIAEVKANPADFANKIVVPAKYLKMSARMVRLESGQYTFHVRDLHGALLADGKMLAPEGLLFIVNENVALHLNKLLGAAGVRADYAPDFKSVMVLRVQEQLLGGEMRWVAEVLGVDILLGFNPTMIANGQLDQAFMILTATPQRAFAHRQDGAEWVTRLGGDDFVSRVRKSVKDAQRTMLAKKSRAVADQQLGQLYNQAVRQVLNENAAQAAIRSKLMSAAGFR